MTTTILEVDQGQARWEFTAESSWLLVSVDYLFESVAMPGAVYGCKGCGARLPRHHHKRHLEKHRASLRSRSKANLARHRFKPKVSAVPREISPDIANLDPHRREVVEKIIELRDNHQGSYPGIAKQLNAQGVAPFGGGKAWYAITVRAQYLRYSLEVEVES